VFTLTYTNTVAPLVTGPAQPTAGAPYFLTPLGQTGNLSLTLVGPSGGACLIEASSNLVDWFAVTNVTLPGGTATFSQPMTAGAHFYRATLLP
jgi:hypothetical protein